MGTFRYLGICKEHRERLLMVHHETVHPQDKRANPPLYHIDKNDSEEEKEKKRARVKKWMDGATAEYKKELDERDAKFTIKDARGKEWVFEKGKEVNVPEDCPLHKRMVDASTEDTAGPFPQFERTDKPKAKIEKPKE